MPTFAAGQRRHQRRMASGKSDAEWSPPETFGCFAGEVQSS